MQRTETEESMSTLKQTLIEMAIFDTNKCRPIKGENDEELRNKLNYYLDKIRHLMITGFKVNRSLEK